MTLHELVKRADPVFDVFSCQILFAGKVPIVSQNGSESECVLVVGTPGIAIFKERRIGRGLILQSITSFCDVRRLIIGKDSVCFESSSSGQRITFKQADQMMIAARIHATRCTLFDPTDLAYDLEVDPDIESVFFSIGYVYQTSCILADRFLANVVKDIKGHLDSHQLVNMCTFLATVKTSIDIDNALGNMGYLPQMASCFAFDKNITEMKIKSVLFGSVGSLVANILANPNGIRRLTFRRTGFDSVPNEYLEVMKKNANLKVDEWIFEECDLSRGMFPDFINGFMKFKGYVKMLTFNKCKFSKAAFDALSQTIYSQTVFTGLKFCG